MSGDDLDLAVDAALAQFDTAVRDIAGDNPEISDSDVEHAAAHSVFDQLTVPAVRAEFARRMGIDSRLV